MPQHILNFHSKAMRFHLSSPVWMAQSLTLDNQTSGTSQKSEITNQKKINIFF